MKRVGTTATGVEFPPWLTSTQAKELTMSTADRKEAVRQYWQELFTVTMAHAVNPEHATRVARMTLKTAEAFVAMQEAYDAGELEPEKPHRGPQLDIACAPNLPKNHPFNMASQKFGDLKLVEKVYDWLEANPEAEAYPEFGWGKPEVNTARTIFPNYVAKGKKLDA